VGPIFLQGGDDGAIFIDDESEHFDASANDGDGYYVDKHRFQSPDQLALPLANAA
jgi:hypothetical protein